MTGLPRFRYLYIICGESENDETHTRAQAKWVRQGGKKSLQVPSFVRRIGRWFHDWIGTLPSATAGAHKPRRYQPSVLSNMFLAAQRPFLALANADHPFGDWR